MTLVETFKSIFESDRDLGEPLSSKMNKQYVMVYRAVEQGVNSIKDKDYITLSRQFAVEHAENNTVVNDTPYVVIKATLSPKNVYDASNPGEYLYSGPDVRGKEIYVSKGDEFEGWEELTKNDFTDKRYDNKIFAF